MKSFSEFKLKPQYTAFTGDKIQIDKILNIPITVLAYKIGQSTVKKGTTLLTMQIEHKGERRVVFTGATILQQLIQQIPPEDFPFTTTIIKNGDTLEFT